MILCPLAAVAGCKSCLINNLCLAKPLLGDNNVIENSDHDEVDVGINTDENNKIVK